MPQQIKGSCCGDTEEQSLLTALSGGNAVSPALPVCPRLASSRGSPRASGRAVQVRLLLHSPARMREGRKKQQNPEKSGLSAMEWEVQLPLC